MLIINGLLIGIAAGLICGLFGMGGGSILVPVIVHFFDLPIKTAIGTSLFVIFFSSVSALINYTKSNNVEKKLIFYIVPSGIAGAQLGALMTSVMSDNAVKYIFVVLVCSLGLKMLFHPENKAEESNKKQYNFKKAAIIGLAAGLVSGLCGVGGAVLIIPLLYIFLKIPIHACIGTALVAILFNSASASAGYLLRDLVDIRTGILLAFGSAIAAPLGAKISINIPREKLRRAFSVILILSSLSILIKTDKDHAEKTQEPLQEESLIFNNE